MIMEKPNNMLEAIKQSLNYSINQKADEVQQKEAAIRRLTEESSRCIGELRSLDKLDIHPETGFPMCHDAVMNIVESITYWSGDVDVVFGCDECGFRLKTSTKDNKEINDKVITSALNYFIKCYNDLLE